MTPPRRIFIDCRAYMLDNDKASDIAWKLRHLPDEVSSAEKIYAAEMIDAYLLLIRATKKERDRICKEIRDTVSY